MKWVRCPKCRTVNDVDRYAMCDGCDSDLAGLSALPSDSPPRASAGQAEAARDLQGSNLAILILGVISALGLAIIFFLPKTGSGEGILSMMGITFLVLIPFLFLLLHRMQRTQQYSTAEKIGCYGCAAIGAVLGAGLLVFIACAASAFGGAW